jgi:hypothetical protein
MAEAWAAAPRDGTEHVLEPRFQPKQAEPLSVRLSADGMRALIAQFHAGVTQQQLAEAYGTSGSSVKRVIASEGAQLWRRA